MNAYILLLLILTFSSCLFATQYPSAGTAFVLPGLHEEGITPSNGVISSSGVIDWEVGHSDLVFGSYEKKEDNARTNAVGYMYNQKFEMNSGHIENEIRLAAEQNGLNFENFFLHFSEDTVLAEVDITHGEKTLLNRKPMIVGYTADAMHAGFWLYQAPPWNVDVFENTSNGGALYLYHSEPFDRVTLKLSQFAQGGDFHIEYPNAIDATGLVTHWNQIQIKKDKTQNMTKNGSVIWDVPEDWQRAATHDGSGRSYGGGQYFGSTYLREGGRLYVIRVIWQPNTDEMTSSRPYLQEVKLKNSFPVVKIDGAEQTTLDGKNIAQWRKIRGFDKSADLNNDNYLSWSEYKNRSNKNATARFRWESRVIPFGRMWNQTSSWALTNLANPNLLPIMHQYYQKNWAESGINGAYNDDTNKLLGANQFHIYSGGNITELEAVAGSDEADRLYWQHFSSFLKGLADLNSNALISVNIGTANLFGRNGQTHLVDAASLYLREHYLVPSTGLSGYSGLSKFWDNSALAYQNKKVIFQATTRYGRSQFFGNTEQNWKADQYSSLAAYYLNHHPDQSYFNQWNSGYIYGSNNTTTSIFWKAGVPKNMAYQPEHLLNIDIGVPSHSISNGHEPIPLMLSTSTPTANDYTVVGDSTSHEAVHVDLPQGLVNLLPTYTYYLHKSNQTVANIGPEDMVLARDFTKGKVLYRTDFFGKNQDFYLAEKVTVSLEPQMRPVDIDGNIGDYVSEVELGGYEGMLLLY